MDEKSAGTQDAADHDLFLIELGEGENVRYVLTERFLVIEPGRSAMGLPWAELAALFGGPTLRAVPLPGRRPGPRRGAGSLGIDAGAGTDPGVATGVQVNVFNAGQGG